MFQRCVETTFELWNHRGSVTSEGFANFGRWKATTDGGESPIYGGFPEKWWVSPTIGFPIKKWPFWGVLGVPPF